MGIRFSLTANILALTPAVKPSTCFAYISTWLALSMPSSLLGSWGSLKSLCHSSSGRGCCFAAARAAFSALRFVCHWVILTCSRPSWRW